MDKPNKNENKSNTTLLNVQDAELIDFGSDALNFTMVRIATTAETVEAGLEPHAFSDHLETSMVRRLTSKDVEDLSS